MKYQKLRRKTYRMGGARTMMVTNVDSVVDNCGKTRTAKGLERMLTKVLPRWSYLPQAQDKLIRNLRLMYYQNAVMANSYHENAGGFVYAHAFVDRKKAEDFGAHLYPGNDGKYIKIGVATSMID